MLSFSTGEESSILLSISCSDMSEGTFLIIPFLKIYALGMRVSNLFCFKMLRERIWLATFLLYVMMATLFLPDLLISSIDLSERIGVINLATLMGKIL